jgi:hypothetical protein
MTKVLPVNLSPEMVTIMKSALAGGAPTSCSRLACRCRFARLQGKLASLK